MLASPSNRSIYAYLKLSSEYALVSRSSGIGTTRLSRESSRGQRCAEVFQRLRTGKAQSRNYASKGPRKDLGSTCSQQIPHRTFPFAITLFRTLISPCYRGDHCHLDNNRHPLELSSISKTQFVGTRACIHPVVLRNGLLEIFAI